MITNRLQDAFIERMATEHGRAHVANGFANSEVRVTTPDGATYKVGLDGIERETGVNFSIDWWNK